MHKLRFAFSVALRLLSGFVEAQSISGSTEVTVDSASGIVNATCATDLDSPTVAYYAASVTCILVDSDGNQVGYAEDNYDSGRAQAGITIQGVAGQTYTATGTHSAEAMMGDPNEPESLPDFPSHTGTPFIDYFGFSSFIAAPVRANAPFWNWYGWGAAMYVPQSRITVGTTTDTKILYLNIPPIIFHAQQVLPARCDQIFSAVIPGYTNADFFNSLLITNIVQYPSVNVPNIPFHGTAGGGAWDAETFPNQSGRPISLYPNFYGTKYGLPFPLFQEFVLVHEGVHHYTGWYDDQSHGSPTFVDLFYSFGYRPQGYGTSGFTYWLRDGCPP